MCLQTSINNIVSRQRLLFGDADQYSEQFIRLVILDLELEQTGKQGIPSLTCTFLCYE